MVTDAMHILSHTRAAIAALLVFLLLSGCTKKPVVENTPPSTVPETTCTVPVIPETTAPAPATVPTEPAAQPEPLPQREPSPEELVRVRDYIPGIFQELSYATEDNFTGQVIYSFSDAYLRYGTVQKLSAVQQALSDTGLSLKIWDGFRPVSAQFRLWEICPDPTYVSDPTVGYSSHSRGNTVDITLVDAEGQELEMPTGFDDFTSLADRDYSDCSQTAANNALYLQELMESAGFTGYWGEWWHFSDTVRYEVAQSFSPMESTAATVEAADAVPFLSQPDLESPILAWITPGEAVTLRATEGDFSLADYRGTWGYVPTRYIQTN